MRRPRARRRSRARRRREDQPPGKRQRARRRARAPAARRVANRDALGLTPSCVGIVRRRARRSLRASRFNQSSRRREACSGLSAHAQGRTHASRSIQTGARPPLRPARITCSHALEQDRRAEHRAAPARGMSARRPAIQSFSLRAKSSARSSERDVGATTDNFAGRGIDLDDEAARARIGAQDDFDRLAVDLQKLALRASHRFCAAVCRGIFSCMPMHLQTPPQRESVASITHQIVREIAEANLRTANCAADRFGSAIKPCLSAASRPNLRIPETFLSTLKNKGFSRIYRENCRRRSIIRTLIGI